MHSNIIIISFKFLFSIQPPIFIYLLLSSDSSVDGLSVVEVSCFKFFPSRLIFALMVSLTAFLFDGLNGMFWRGPAQTGIFITCRGGARSKILRIEYNIITS
jgi:hypothetical protein